jgi:hypothetical protein
VSRGIYSSMLGNDFYQDSEKELIVELQRYHRYWYDLIVHPNEVAEYFDSRELIVDYLKAVKKNVEDNLEKRFVYFICSRTKIRFNIDKKPFYNPITKKVKIHILVGKNEKKQTIKCQFFDIPSNKFCNPKLDITDKYITVTDSRGDLITASIHDFLEQSNINLGLYSNVEYVGYTKNPHTRPTNSSHAGLSDVLYKVSNESFDTFIYFNVFKVTTRAVNNQAKLNIIISNAMTNELDVELEGKLIEKCFIFYFDALSQNRNKDKEMKELKNNLDKIYKENKIKRVNFIYEFEEENEYGVFSSSKVSPSVNHTFNVIKVKDKVEIKTGLESFETTM